MAAIHTNYSLYIPSLKKVYSEERIINIFYNLGIGIVTRIDFVPIMKTIKGKAEPVEDAVYRKAFVYTKCYWDHSVTDDIDQTGSCRIYPNLPFNVEPTQSTEYWLLLKNKIPVPYAATSLNVHQLAHNNGLLETKLAEMEQEMSRMKEEIERLKDENETMSVQIAADIARERDRCQHVTEESAHNFVNSFENVLRMMEERENLLDNDEEQCEDQREQESELTYDDSGEMTPRGRRVITTENGTYIQYDLLDVDGYNNGDVSPRGELMNPDELETCSECGLKKKIVAYGWRHADDNMCRDCLHLPGMDYYEC